MAMLDRYKKKGGFLQLLQLIETSPKAKQEQFLSLIASESPAWEEALKRKAITADKILSWQPEILAEIVTRLPLLTVSVILHGMNSDEVERVISALPPITRRKITDGIAEVNPNPGEKASCLMKMQSEVRGYISQGILKLDKIDPELAIPENIEDILGTHFATLSLEDLDGIKQETNKIAQSPSGASDATVHQQEIEFLKRKVNLLVGEVNALKQENIVLKDKLAQIKKIA